MTDDPEQIEVESGTIQYTPRRRHRFGERYAVLFPRRFFPILAQLSPRETKVLFAMLCYCEFGNAVRVHRSVLSEMVGFPVNHVSTCCRNLERLGVLNVEQRGEAFVLNEEYLWRGSAEDYQARRRERREQQREDPDE